jgi:hypothetical protein
MDFLLHERVKAAATSYVTRYQLENLVADWFCEGLGIYTQDIADLSDLQLAHGLISFWI